MIASAPDKSRITPMAYYYLAYFAGKLGRPAEAMEYYRLAAAMPPDYVFPFENEAIEVLGAAMKARPQDARAPYYLGNLFYDWQPSEAVKLWEQSAALDPSFPIVHRNLATAYSHQPGAESLNKAIASLEKAVSLERKYPIHFFELDELYEAAGAAPEKRLALLEKHAEVVAERDDALARAVALKVVMGKYDEAISLMTGRQYEVWEGGMLNVADYWTDAHLLRGRQRAASGKWKEALADFDAAGKVPDNLPSERRGGGGRDAEIAYWKGTAEAALGDTDAARRSWREAAAGADAGRSGRAQDDLLSARGVQAYFQALSLAKLGEQAAARTIFENLVRAAAAAGQTKPHGDFFGSFGSREPERHRTAVTHYVAALGYLGLDQKEKAKQEFRLALKARPDHLGARTGLAQID
jgi:tetratricopeptide (TPR) repeat protein